MPNRDGPVHVATITCTHHGKAYQTHLLCRTYREGNKVKHQTLDLGSVMRTTCTQTWIGWANASLTLREG